MAYTAVCNGVKTTEFAARFVSTWNQFLPEQETDLLVICNGGPISGEQGLLFASLNAKFFPRSNDGFDIGGYIQCARGVLAEYDMVLFCGESVHFFRPGWLRQLAGAANKFGKGMYGVFASHVIRAHLQTTAFFCFPAAVAEYPLTVNDRPSRLEFEHGERSLWRRLHARNVPVKLVTWSGCYDPRQWRLPPNGLWSGDQSAILMHSNHTQRWAEADETRKRNWTASANRPYK